MAPAGHETPEHLAGPGKEVPEHLKKTVAMIRSAFPDGIPDQHYRAVLYLLHDHMSYRCLAAAVVHCCSKPWERIYNDALGIPGDKPAEESIAFAKQKLAAAGYVEWVRDAD